MTLPKLELTEVLKQDVSEILGSRSKSKVLHKTKDIDASGDEVENTVRRVLRRKLPQKYYVSQGHITDEELTTSAQLDLVIADNSGSPVLFTAENGTEYFPYESIYGFAEIKSTYYASKKYLDAFINSTQKIYEELTRAETPTSRLSQDVNLVTGSGITFDSADKRPYKNPLFKFMFFVDSNDFKIEDIKESLSKIDDKYLPNIICLLEKGIIVKAKIITDNGTSQLGPVELNPEFILPEDKNEYEWVFLELGDEDDRSSANLAFLIFALNSHLKDCLVLRPNIINYYNSMFKHKGTIIK